MMRLPLAIVAFFVVSSVAETQRCERLKATLTYTQEKAPRDLSGVLPVVVERVNRELEGVMDVEVEWTGSDLHGRIGEHTIQCKVTRLLSAINPDHLDDDDVVSVDEHGRKVIVQCFELPFTIEDTNECTLPIQHPMRHQCQLPAVCVNTIGSYECLCPKLLDEPGTIEQLGDQAFWANVAAENRDPWEKSYARSTRSSCPDRATTHGCCEEFGHSNEGKHCRASFRCPVDSCSDSKTNNCAAKARCIRERSPLDRPNYTCQCPNGLMGNGHACRPGIDATPKPMVRFDGVTPTEETVKNNYYCGCNKPQVDACEGFPPCAANHEICAVTASNSPMCACKPGYVNNNDGYGCVDETPPVLKLRNDPQGDKTMRLVQGDVYKEYAVEIIDENAEEYLRSLRITYSKPLPPGCLSQIGEFHVNYTVATPWTSPPYVRVTRRVVIEDIDECTLDVSKYASSCPELIPQCDTDNDAVCVNTVGSYTCQCPQYTSGDGFKTTSSIPSDRAPEGYLGGTSCRDTSKPSIDVLGPNPKIFKVCKCGGLGGIMGGPKEGEQHAGCADRRSRYGQELKNLIDTTGGAELCATHGNVNPKASDCVRAMDRNHKGSKDLSARVVIGEPVKSSPVHWRVPYDVVDNSGNKAKTAYRDVIIEEVDLNDLEHRIRAEVMAEKDKAVQEAVAAEKSRYVELEASMKRSSQKQVSKPECPACPACKCKGQFDKSQCNSYCESKYGNKDCPADWLGSVQRTIDAVSSSPVVLFFMSLVGVVVAVLILRLIFTLLFNPAALLTNNYDYGPTATFPPQTNHTAVATHTTPTATTSVRSPFSEPPQATRRPPESGLFSPPYNRGYGNGYDPNIYAQSPGGQQHQGYDDSIYQTTPTNAGELRRRPR